MNNSIKLLFLLVLLQIFITGCSKTDDDELNTAIVSADSTAAASVPVISEVTAAASPTSVNTPNYIFSSSEAGTITYGGSCSSSTTSAAVDNNKITFNVLADGIYSNCTISVTDSASNTSNILSVSSFTVDATAPTLSEVKEVSTSTSDDTSSYTFSSTEAGTITYGGSCTSSTTSASAANNTITFNALADGTYSNCTIIVTDSVGNSSNFLTITSFTVAIQSTIEEVTAILTPNNDSTPNYTFSSTEAGTITYGGSCSSSDTTVISGNNTITLNALADGTYSNCTITVTNTEGEAGDPITITSFVVDSAMETGTINGSVLGDYTNSSLSGVSVSYANSGITMGNIITDSSGDFSQTLILGTYTLTYNMSGYLDVIQSATLETDNQTLVVSTLRMLSDTCSSGTISGTIKDAVSNNSVTGVSLNVRSGVNVTSGTILKTDVTSNTGTYSLSSMSAGWYTIETSKSGYITSTFNVYACSNVSGQNNSISTTLATGAMRIVLSWNTIDDLDSHLTGPDNLSREGHYNASHDKFHLYFPSVFRNFYYATNNFSCSSCSNDQMSDNVTLDLDSPSGIGSTGGPETITIAAVRSGTYHYTVHNYTERGTNNLKLAASEASVKVYYDNNVSSFNVPSSAGDLWYSFEFDKSSGFTENNNMGSDVTYTADIFAPTLSEVTAVTSPTNDTTPNYIFSSNEAGTITYGGSCSSLTTSASAANNTITFSTLSGGTYSDCTITVTDSSSNPSSVLSVSSFSIDTTAPSLSEVTAVTTPTNDNTSSYTFSSNEAGTITYGGSCSSQTTSASASNNTIIFNEMADGTYTDCTISVSDNVSNNSSALSVSSFTIDQIAPTLSEVTAVTTPTNDNTPSYTFSSNEAGTITYGGSCSSLTTSASASNNTIILNTLADGAYSNCTIVVTDSAGNTSSSLPISSFTVAIPPILAEVTAVPTPTSDNTSNYTFSSNEAGTITYGGSCSSLTTSALAADNTITFNELTDGTYDNCTIAVTDNTSNTSDNLTVSSFTIGAIKPTLVQVTAVPTLTNDNTSNYTFFSTLSGTITYGGSCSSDDNTSVADNNTITFNSMADGIYSDCTLRVTSSDVSSDNLSVNSFTVDATAPTLSLVTSIPTATNDNTPSYTFSSSEAGAINYGGSCSSFTTSASVDNNTITFNALSDSTYSNCTITVTDNASNASNPLSVNSFTIDRITPTLSQVTAVTTPTSDNMSNYTFSSSEVGTITYGGSCSSLSSVASAGNNEITFNAMADGTHSNCSITVTDSASNASSSLTPSSFTIGAVKPALVQVTGVPTPTSDNTSNYTFFSTLAGTISYGGSCNSTDNTSATAGNNTITFDALADGTYSNCSVRVTSNGVGSDNLSVNIFEIDTIVPTLSSVTIASSNSDNTTAKVGTRITVSITSSGATQSYSVSIAGQTATVTGSGTSWSAYYDMTSSYSQGAVSLSISFSDLSGNSGNTVTSTTNSSIVQFDKTSPTISEVTAVTSPTGDTTPNYTFSSNEAGTITYGGTCSSLTTLASASNNPITFNTLNGGSYSNCTIRVTDNASNVSNILPVSSFTIDTIAPTVSEVTAVTSPTNDTTPNYIFSSNEAGTITYGGSCSSLTTSASAANNNITFNALADGTYDNCTIRVTDSVSNISDNLTVSFFTIGATKPALAEVTAVPNPTNDNTSNYTFFSTLSGTITYGGSCSSLTTSASADNNTITFNALADATYSDCILRVTSSSVDSDNLSVSSFTIDTIAPTVSEVTAVTSPTNDTTPNYTFSSNEAGTINYGGNCNSSISVASVGNNTIAFNTLNGGTYSNCTISVTDNASNSSIARSVTSFTIDTTAPVLALVTAVTTPTNDNSSSYTFSSDEAGNITYGGSCSSLSSVASSGNNAITFNELAEGTYSNCTISVTDNASNTSSALSVSSFTIDTTAPSLSEVTAVTTPTNATTPNYIFSSNEAGTIAYGGSCSSPTTSASSSNNNITFNSLSPATYSTCSIRVTDSAGNQSDALLVSSFIIDTTAPTVSNASPNDNQSLVSVSDNISVTFSESMDNNSVTTNISNTTCSGSLQLSSDNFSTCIQMGTLATVSNSSQTFTVTPSLKMFYSTTYKIRVTTSAEDSAGNNIASQFNQTDGFKTAITFPITAGSEHSCLMLDNGSVKCWGGNSYGQLGLWDNTTRGDNSSEMGDNLNSIDLGSGRTATAIEAGKHHTCAILDNASIKCWGSNSSGQLGLGNTNNLGDASGEMGDNLPTVDLGTGITAKSITTGDSHTCAILDNSSIKCWGSNASGQLGLGDTSTRGDGSGEMGDNLPTVDLGSGRTVKSIATGDSHTCAILDNSAIKCWGFNTTGQLGLGDTNNRGDGSGAMGDTLPVVELGSGRTAKAIAAGDSHTCAILDNSAIKCWGRSDEGQMGKGGKNGSNFQIGDSSGEMGDSLTAIEIGTGRTATAISAGKYHTCTILDNSSIKCWGSNNTGQLGLGDTSNRGDLNSLGSSEMGDSLSVVDLGAGRTARGITAGDNQTCAILDNASIKCWGSNSAGQLGLGDTSNRGDGSGEMGDNLPVISL